MSLAHRMLKETPLPTGGSRWDCCGHSPAVLSQGLALQHPWLGSQRALGPRWPLVVPGVESASRCIPGPGPGEPQAVRGVCGVPDGSPGFRPGPGEPGGLACTAKWVVPWLLNRSGDTVFSGFGRAQQ